MSFFSVSPALIIFCHSLKLTDIHASTAHSCMEKCTKFGQSILSKIIKTVATSCQILRLICTKFDFGWGSAPDPAGRAHSAPPDSYLDLRGLLLREGGSRKGRGKGKGERKWRDMGRGEWERRGEEGGGGERRCGRGEGRFASS